MSDVSSEQVRQLRRRCQQTVALDGWQVAWQVAWQVVTPLYLCAIDCRLLLLLLCLLCCSDPPPAAAAAIAAGLLHLHVHVVTDDDDDNDEDDHGGIDATRDRPSQFRRSTDKRRTNKGPDSFSCAWSSTAAAAAAATAGPFVFSHNFAHSFRKTLYHHLLLR